MKTFYHLLGNNVIAGITNFTVWFAIIFYVYLNTQSVLATSIMSGVFLVTTAISGFWFGGLVDRYKKKQMMLVSSLASLVIYAVCFMIYLAYQPEAFSRVDSVVLWIFVPLLLFGVIAGNIRNIALTTLVTVLVPEKRRDKANGLVGTAFGIAFLVTSVISGFLVGKSGMFLVLILAMVATALVIVHLFFLDFKEKVVKYTDEKPKNLDIPGTIKIISSVPGLFPLIFFTMFNNFLGGVFMSLMDAYGLSLVSVEVWGLLWGFLSTAFIIGGLVIAKWGLGKNPLNALFKANFIIWGVCIFFTIQPSIILLAVGAFIYLTVVPYIEAAEQTIVQKVVPPERQGRVFGFAQSIEQAASPITSFAIGPIAQYVFIPFMTTGAGVELIGGWFGTGPSRGIALVFTIAGIIGFVMSLVARNTKYYHLLSKRYLGKSS